MPRPLKVLIAEDNPDDAELVLRELRRAGFEPDWHRVDTEAAYLERLQRGLDLVLSDFQMPHFSGFRALELLQQSGLAVPFILVSGTIGEDTAVAAMKSGATDYLLKDRLGRLGAAVTQALAEYRLRGERVQVDEAFRASEARFKTLSESAPLGIFECDAAGRVIYYNPALGTLTGRPVEDSHGHNWENCIHPDDRAAVSAGWARAAASGNTWDQEQRLLRPDGSVRWVHTFASPHKDAEGGITGFIGTVEDITERKRAELALIASEIRYRRLFESAQDGILILDAETGVIEDVNPYLIKLLDLTKEQFLKKKIWELGSFKNLIASQEKFTELQRNKYVRYDNLPLETSDGRRIEVEFVSNVYLVSGANVIQCNVRNITERKRVESALKLSDLSVQNASAPTYWIGRDGRILRVNRAASELLGYTEAEFLSMKIIDLDPGFPPERWPGHWEELRERKRMSFQTRHRRKDGRIVPVEVDLNWFEFEGQEYNFAFARDISKRKRAEEELRRSEDRFRAIFEQAAMGVALADANTGRFFQVNQRYCEIVGRSQEELEQLTFQSITHPQDIDDDLETMQQFRVGSLHAYSREKRYLRKDGSEVWVLMAVSPMWAPGESPSYMIAIVQDITERRRLEEQLRQAQKMDAIGTLAGGIAHDFNNILAAINGYTELARLTLKEDPEVRAYLASVMVAASRATDLVRQILTFSHQQPLERKPVELRPIIIETLKLLRATIPSTIEFTTALAEDAPTVLADVTQIHQILMNLGTNAWHAMKDRPGWFNVKLEKCSINAAQAAAEPRLHPGDYARVIVTDTGCGMDQATLRRIFEPFFTTKPLGDGTGLGLAVMHGIMDSHDGVVTVESQPGEGTSFSLYFPACAGEAALAPAQDGPVPHGAGERVLVVDDEEMIAQLMQEALTKLGYEVEFTTQPANALAMVRTDPNRFALVLTDQTMPGITGFVLASKIRQIRPDLPVIMMTGYTAALISKGVEASGICELLQKPISIRALAIAVHAALSSQPAPDLLPAN